MSVLQAFMVGVIGLSISLLALLVVGLRRGLFSRELEDLGPTQVLTITLEGDEAVVGAVRVDGAYAGQLPFSGTFQHGRHQIEIGADGYKRFIQWVELRGDDERRLAVSLERLDEAHGSLAVETTSSGASVWIDGQPYPGRAPLVIDGLAPGGHLIEVRTPTSIAWKSTCQVQSGQCTTVTVDIPAPQDIRASAGEKRPPVAATSSSVRPLPTDRPLTTADLLNCATFTSIYDEWLPVREESLNRRLKSLVKDSGETQILLLNATKGREFFSATIDFFVGLHRQQPLTRLVSASYFSDEIFEFERDVALKGIETVRPEEVLTWSLEALNRFALVIAIGPSEVFGELLSTSGLVPKLVLVDFAFYHQILEVPRLRALYSQEAVADIPMIELNPVTCYSCQPEQKIRTDLQRLGYPLSGSKWRWRWGPYIPFGFASKSCYRADRQVFDVVLLGTRNRIYAQLIPEDFKGLEVLFIGSKGGSEVVNRLRTETNVTTLSNLSAEEYYRVLSLCRTVVLPARPGANNCFLSVVDAIASGVPLVTTRHNGLKRAEERNAPIIFVEVEEPEVEPEERDQTLIGRISDLANLLFRSSRRPTHRKEKQELEKYTPRPNEELSRMVHDTLNNEVLRKTISDQSIEYTKQQLDIYTTLEDILIDSGLFQPASSDEPVAVNSSKHL